ncbi:hypothetical protein [Staphylococcus sp. FSL W8-0774]|uniref:hypothetical protein n=1 Tax=Staphylococcus sp. FSL W8-0774 TaxID=2954632 RepID=UPI0030FCE3CE
MLATIFSLKKIIRGLGNIPNKLARLPRYWLAKPMLAKPHNDLINFALSYKVKLI